MEKKIRTYCPKCKKNVRSHTISTTDTEGNTNYMELCSECGEIIDSD